jgi:hypothetical protein
VLPFLCFACTRYQATFYSTVSSPWLSSRCLTATQKRFLTVRPRRLAPEKTHLSSGVQVRWLYTEIPPRDLLLDFCLLYEKETRRDQRRPQSLSLTAVAGRLGYANSRFRRSSPVAFPALYGHRVVAMLCQQRRQSRQQQETILQYIPLLDARS